jgi:hypothetical protein
VAVEAKRKANNKKQEVWELSFDWKHCIGEPFIQQKLNYIHLNPCQGRWNLCAKLEEYKHSSAKFYLRGKEGFYKTDSMAEMAERIFVNRQNRRMIDATSGKGRNDAAK